MSDSPMLIPAHAESGSIEAVVIRCGCGNPASHAGEPCPTPRKHEDLGTIAYFSRNPLRQAAWNVFNFLKSRLRSK